MSGIVEEYTMVIRVFDLKRGYFRLTLAPFSKVRSIRPGQFIHVKVPNCGVYFRRAFSVYDVDRQNRSIDIVFKVLGRGTAALARVCRGESMNILGPLGSGFTMPSRRETAVLVAGGIGMPPMYLLARCLVEKGFNPEKILFFYGGNERGDLVDLARIRKLGTKVIPATVDGSYGFKGMVTDAVAEALAAGPGRVRMYACGPEPMLRTIDEMAKLKEIPGQVSLEAPMPCGIGICLGCIKPLREGGYTRVCRDGPVYEMGKVII
ncbi:MAG: dihydroorotate dehydrogenase electron transfer subunit [Candidatus Zixiibacteriota bacterium]|nr:MAG: dihydroorotate dehydrogenase electron transfer subunit [candidate division Zixibacteria bacterium]